VDAAPRIVQKYGGDVERDQDGDSWKHLTNNMEVRESGTNRDSDSEPDHGLARYRKSLLALDGRLDGWVDVG
jgi:hypothetical protein